MDIIIWLIIMILLLCSDLITASIVSCFYSLGALVSVILSIFKVSFIYQFICFILVGTITLILFRKVVTKYLIDKRIIISKEKLIGEVGVVVKDIKKEEMGIIKIQNKKWKAISKKNIAKDSKIIVTDILKDKLIVETKR